MTDTLTLEEKARFFVKKKVELLLSGIAGYGPPISAMKIASSLSIRVSEEDLGDISGFLAPTRDALQIKINSRHSPERQNYSCAHELIHTFFLDGEGRKLIQDKIQQTDFLTSNRFEERLCDMGAAELLMPYSMFKAEMNKLGLCIRSVKPLAQLFFASSYAIAIRMAEISPRRCFAFQWPKEEEVSRKESVNLHIEYAKALKFRSSYYRTKNSLITARIDFHESTINECLQKDFIYSHEHLVIRRLSIPCFVESIVLSREPLRVISLAFPEAANLV